MRNLKRPTVAGLFLAGLIGLAGCGERELYEDNVPLDQVPKNVMEAAKKQLPDVNFQDAWKEKVNGEDAYEIRGANAKGKRRDVKVSSSGKILEVD